MKTTKPIAVHVDRLAAALAAQGIDIKRTKTLELVAAAFGFHNTHECTAASQRGDLTPPAASPLCRISIPGGEELVVLRDPVTNAPYAIDRSFITQVAGDERREAYGPSPYGRLLDLRQVAAHCSVLPTMQSQDANAPGEEILRILVELETDGPVTPEAVLSNVHNAIHSWRGAMGLSHDSDEGSVGEITTRLLEPNEIINVQQYETLSGEPMQQILTDSKRTAMHVAIIHHKHGIDLRMGTTMALVSRQVGEYVRENWDDAWQADQDTPEDDRGDVPETPEGLDDDQAEEMYFQAVGRFSASNYVEYEVIDVAGLAARAETPPMSEPTTEPFPGVPDDLFTIFAARDGDTFRETFRIAKGENEEHEGRKLAAKSFGLKLDDYKATWLDGDADEDEQLEAMLDAFDGDLDGIEVEPACLDPDLKSMLEASWEAAHRLPVDDPLRDRIRRQVLDAMPRPADD